MKKTIFYSLFSALFMLTSCSMFEIDNYEEPAETIWGEVVDEATGKRVLTDQGSEGIRVRLTELSWGDNVQHNPDFYCMMDGTFQNTKIFKGEYNVRIDGPFIPLVRENTDGTLLHDGSVNTEISGTTKVKFEVQPFLNVEFVGNPQVSNGVIKAQVRVTRGVSDEVFREKIQPMGRLYHRKLLLQKHRHPFHRHRPVQSRYPIESESHQLTPIKSLSKCVINL